jgi:hypothetical protein
VGRSRRRRRAGDGSEARCAQRAEVGVLGVCCGEVVELLLQVAYGAGATANRAPDVCVEGERKEKWGTVGREWRI